MNAYLQRALANLLTVLQDNLDAAIQCVRDFFAMSNKALDQNARSGALHHLVHRRAAIADTGLGECKDIKIEFWDCLVKGSLEMDWKKN